MRRTLGALVLIAALSAGCGSGDAGGGASETPRIMIKGDLIYRSLGCAHGAETRASGKTVIIRDGEGGILGTTTSQSGECSEKGAGSTITARYSVTVLKAEFYELSVEGIDGSVTRSHDDLVDADYSVDLDIGSSY